MKFYRDYTNYNDFYHYKIMINNLTSIYTDSYYIRFYKNGKKHNSKNFAFINKNCYGRGRYFLNGEDYGNQDNFTKQSWRRFTKLQIFL
jgi:hypothetical protein